MSLEHRQDYQLKGKGNVFSFTVIPGPEYAPAGFQFQAPYAVALIKLEEGPVVAAMLTDLSYHFDEVEINGEKRMIKNFDIEIGMSVEMVTRLLKIDGDEDRGLRIYGYKFRPPIQRSDSSE